ncbi:hypothetical protein A2U01_0055026, partial [Trifolium medium]|nr:hypothetical protein [Trifolium medium]
IGSVKPALAQGTLWA